MKEIFEMRDENQVKSLKLYGPKIWNALPVNIKTAKNLNAFKDLIKKWNGVSCNRIFFTHQ